MRNPFERILQLLTYGKHSYQQLDPVTTQWVGRLYELLTYTSALEILQRGAIQPDFRYRYFTKAKRDGSARQLCEPDARLKALQQALVRQIQTCATHPAALGYRRKRSNADHAWAHAGASQFIIADIADFFPSTTAHRVETWWRNFTECEETGRLLALLTTDRDALPQGAPTSPILSNLVNIELDAALARRAESAGGKYTRYCDDLMFSWRAAQQAPSDFEVSVRAVLREYGYRLNERKGWQVYGRRDQPTVTGIRLTRDGGVEVPPEMQQIMRDLARKGDSAAQQRLAGYRSYETMVKRKPEK